VSAVALLVRHRTVDLVAMTAAHALRSELGLGAELVALTRDDVYVIEGEALGAPEAWSRPCTERAHWFNPNKHRHALFEAAPGAVEAVRNGTGFPRPWLGRVVSTDRSDLPSATDGGRGPDVNRRGLSRWLALPPRPGVHAVAIASWDLDQAVTSLPPGPWPHPRAQLVRLQLWGLAVAGKDAETATARASEVAVTRRREQGLLIHPHVEGWIQLETPWSLHEEQA
jgi:hypothetical protein